MTNAEAVESLRENYCCNRSVCELHSVDLCQKEKCEIWMAISALQAQEAKTQLSREDTTSDCISRQDAIDAVGNMLRRKFGIGGDLAEITLACLPSAQPLVKDSPSLVKDLVKDCISRQAAIAYAISGRIRTLPTSEDGENWIRTEEVRQSLLNMPSAQPETAKRIVGKSRDGMTLWYQCDMCNEPVDAQDDFCRGCGRRLTDG